VRSDLDYLLLLIISGADIEALLDCYADGVAVPGGAVVNEAEPAIG
jgi:hypothetical protein